MSSLSASVSGLRSGARALRTAAARTGLAAWHVGRGHGEVPQWHGRHGELWRQRALETAAAARAVEAVLSRFATAVELYACTVQDAQQRHAALAAEGDDLRALLLREHERWREAAGPARGAQPQDLVSFDLEQAARHQHVEAEVEAAAGAFASRVEALRAELAAAPSVESVLRAAQASPAYSLGYALPSGLSTLGAHPARALGLSLPAVPARARGPLRAVGRVAGPVGVVGDVLALRQPEQEGRRDDVDQAAAVVGLTSYGGGLVLGAAAAVTGVAVAPVAGAVLAGAGLLTVGYGVVMVVTDLRAATMGGSAAAVVSGTRRPGAPRDLPPPSLVRPRSVPLPVGGGGGGLGVGAGLAPVGPNGPVPGGPPGPVPGAAPAPIVPGWQRSPARSSGVRPREQAEVSGVRTAPSRSSGSGP